MNVSLNRIFSFVFVAGLAGAGLSHATTQAQFHLPVTAHWGLSTLAPGDYRIEQEKSASGLKIFVISGGSQHMQALSITSDAKERSGKSSLQLVQWRGEYFVREYRSDDTGKTYVFALPKHVSAQPSKNIEIRD